MKTAAPIQHRPDREPPGGQPARVARRRWLAGLPPLCVGAVLIGRAVVIVGAAAAEDRSGTVSETDLKAGFLVKLPMFVTWPPVPAGDSQAPIVIGILGEDPFGAMFDATLKPLRTDGRPFAVRRFRDLADLGDCHILFISRSEQGRWAEIFKKLGNRPVLTVADLPGFAARGGMFNCFVENGRLRFECNREAIQRGGLKVSGRLLQIARIVRDEKPAADH